MDIIRPVTITDARLTASNIPEPDVGEPAAYNPATTYAVGDRCHLTATHRIYESTGDGNTGNDPAVKTDKWLDIGPTNRWALFDRSIESQSRHADEIVLTITPNAYTDAVALLNLSATSVRVQVADSDYDRTIELTRRSVLDWYDYFYAPFELRTDVLFRDLPLRMGNVITITITAGSGDAACGALVLGHSKIIGDALMGTSVGITDYSRKAKDEWGNTTIVQRSYNKRMRVPLLLQSNFVDEFQRLMAQYRATPLVWIVSDRYDSTLVYGFYRDFDVVISYPTHAECSLEIEGLT